MSKVAAPAFDLLEHVQGTWRSRRVDWEGVLELQGEPTTCFIFASSRLFLECEDLNSTLSTCYGIPRTFWSPFARKANGFFGCENINDADGNAKEHITWFRLIIKKVDPMQSSYHWSEMSFFTRWTPDSTINLCFDVPKASQFRLHQALASGQQPLNVKDMYASHAIILDEIVAMFDESVWALRDGVRGIEKRRNARARQDIDYNFLHDFARHVIHSTETLGVALDTVNSMIEQQDIFIGAPNHAIYQYLRVSPQTQQYFRFQHQMLKSLKARSESNQSRLQNEINFAFNSAAQSQSETLLSINKGTKDDGAAMRAVALVTLTFLPATFVSTIFSMTFFNFSPGTESQPEAWVVSDKFWVYWSVTIPLTILTMASWFMWRYWQQRGSGII